MSGSWPQVPLGEVLRLVRRPEPVRPDVTYNILGAHWYAAGLYTKEITTGAGIQATNLYRVEEGDFVYNRLFAWKGSFAVATKENAGCYVSNEFPCFRPHPDRLDPGFLRRYFSRTLTWDEALALSTGGTPTSRNRLKEDKLLAFRIPLPPLDEQRRIVAQIEALAAKIEEARGLRQKATEEANSLVRSAVDVVIGTGWPIVPLNDAANPDRSITYGIVQAGNDVPDGVPYIRVSDMAKPILTLTGMLRTAPHIAARYARSMVREGDIVFAIRATVGKMRIVPKELDGANLTQGTARIAPSEKATAPYLYWALQGRVASEVVQNVTKGSTFKEITLGRLRTIPVPLPPITEQHRIVRKLNELQVKVEVLKRIQAETAAELDALLPSILDKAFKGEL